MPLMSGTPVLNRRCRRILLGAALIAGALSACETVTTAPPASHVVGSWRLDESASDDPDATIAKAMHTAEAKLHHRLAKYGYGLDRDATSPERDTGADGPDYSFDTPGDRYGGPGFIGPDFRSLQARLHEALDPPDRLVLEADSDLVTITEDQLPPRDYHTGETLSRIDEYGTARISAKWSHDAFIMKSSYSSPRGRRTDTYEVSPATGALTVTQEFDDPTVGKIIVHSIYRRS
jgi:hypothetical protein